MSDKKYNIAIGSDHNGFALKQEVVEYLKEKGHKVKDFGQYDVDPPARGYDVPERVALSISNKEYDRGILICGSGDGMCISANKIAGCIASLCYDTFSAEVSRARNNANIIALGSKTTAPDEVKRILDIWFETEFDDEKKDKRNFERNKDLIRLDNQYRNNG